MTAAAANALANAARSAAGAGGGGAAGDVVPLGLPTFPRLFTPITLGARRPVLQLPCRALMNPLYLNVEADHPLRASSDNVWNVLAEFYAQRARGGTPLLITGGVSPSFLGKWNSRALSLTRKEMVSKYRIITDAVHDEGGKIMLQMLHGGRSTCSPLMLAASGSAPCPHRAFKWARPLTLPRFMVRYVITEFMRCAELARDAGFDGVEIPCCHDTLLHNFWSPASNRRTDEFGGQTQETRARALLQTVDAVRQAVPEAEFLVGVRLSVHDLLPGEGSGVTRSDVHYVTQQLAESRLVDLLCCVVGQTASPVQTSSSLVPRGTFHQTIRAVRECVREVHERVGGADGINMPVVACAGRYPKVDFVEEALRHEVCDMVGLGRPLLADANLIANARAGRPLDTMPCIGCNKCLDRALKGMRVGCAINPIAGYELEYLPLNPVHHRKTVAVVGAGVAGITAAMTLARRGHMVHLYEKHAEIGGQLNLAKVIPGKEDYWFYLEWAAHQLRSIPNIYVRMQATFNAKEVSSGDQHFDAVVVAVGSMPRPMSSHTGGMCIEHRSVVSFADVLARRVQVGRRVLVIGNGPNAYDVCSYLVHDPKVTRDVSLWSETFGVDLDNGKGGLDERKRAAPVKANGRDVTMFLKPNNDPDLMRCKGWSQRQWLKAHGVEVFNTALFGKVDDQGVHFCTPLPEQRSLVLPVDTVVFALGMIPNFVEGVELFDWHFQRPADYGMSTKDFGVYVCGSCRDVENMCGAGEQDLLKVVREAFEVANKI
jgi:2,4-dienoyl-CoA reductase (NADPH2)